MTSLTILRAPLARSPLCSSPFRLLSTTAVRRAAPPPVWPPQRPSSGADTASSAETPSSPASPSAPLPTSNPYAAPNTPSSWARFASEDFNRRSSVQRSGANSAAIDKYNEVYSTELNRETRELPFPLKPITGRTTYVSQRTDVNMAFRLCNTTLSLNRTRNQWHKQRFHERPGLRRKRLATQTWRRKFRTCMITTVKRVKDLARQGW